MKLFGLTGGVGMGKTVAADILARRGIPVIDTDVLAREIVEPGQPALEEIRSAFGGGVIGGDGRLRRDALAEQVFADEAKRRRLESITHPRIRERWSAEVEEWTRQGRPLGVVVIPLLFETDSSARFQAVICVACSEPTQRHRLLARGWSQDQIDQRIRAQWPIEKKMAASHYVIWNEGTVDACAGQLLRVIEAELLPGGKPT